MSKRSKPEAKPTAVSRARTPRPPMPAIPTSRKPHHYRLIVELTMGLVREAVTLVERGPLGLCEQRGMEAANYGVFRLSENGTREWHRPTRIMIEPVKEHNERSEGDANHSEANG